MTPALMTPRVREEFANLSAEAKADLLALIRNKIQILTGSNELEASDDRVPEPLRRYASQRNRAAQIALEELAELFGEPPQAHL